MLLIKKLNLKQLIKTLYVDLKRNKFKPSIKFSSDTIYSLGDASRTAICLGLFYNINPILLYIFSILFKAKLLKNDFKPIFKDEILFEFTISSIITFNLAQIIYIFFIIYTYFFLLKFKSPYITDNILIFITYIKLNIFHSIR